MKFSVVIPTYNRVNVISDTINSVIKQSYKNLEIIIVDDGSIDGTERFIKEQYLLKDSRIKYLKRGNERLKGANSCRNIGIEASYGDYIAFLDSDDQWLPNRLEHVNAFLNKNKPFAIYSGAIVNYVENKIKRVSRQIAKEESIFDFLIRDDTFSPTPSLVIRADVAKQVLFNEQLKRHQDFDFIIRVSDFYPWQYFENYEVIVNWQENKNNKIDFLSCMYFYKMHSHLSYDKKIRINYLLWISEVCVKQNLQIEAIKFFGNQLKIEGIEFDVRQKLMFYYPRIFYLLYFLKRKI